MSNTLGSHALRAVIWEQCGGNCSCCGRPMNPFRDFSIDHKIATHNDFSIDHKIATHNGGSDELSNLQGVCKSCNSRKGARPDASSWLAQMSPDEAERHRMALVQSTAMSSLTLEVRDPKEIAAHLGIEVFRLTPGGRFRVWNQDVSRIKEYAAGCGRLRRLGE